MKTLNEFINELTAKKELQEEMSKIRNNDELAAFLKTNDCDATTEEFWALTDIVKGMEGEIPDELAETAAGGSSYTVGIPSSDDAASGAINAKLPLEQAERLRIIESKLELIKQKLRR